MSIVSGTDILIDIDTVDQLFNSSDINPFSDKPVVLLGEAGLPYAIRQELSHGLRNWQGKRLIIQLPPDQITPDLQEKIRRGIKNFGSAKIAQNNTKIHLSRMSSLLGLGIAILIAGLLLTLLAMITQTLLASAPEYVVSIVAGLVTIFIWSTVWNPWDRLVYEWIEPWRENRILRTLLQMEIVVQPGPSQQ